MENKIIFDKFVLEEPQTVFTLTRNYIPNSKTLLVWYCGVLLQPGEDYTEVNKNTVEINFDTNEGDTLVFVVMTTMPGNIHINKRRLRINPSATHQEFVVEDVRRDYKLIRPYSPGKKEIAVYYNGVLLMDSQYDEVDKNTIVLAFDPFEGDTVTVLYTLSFSAHIGSDNGDVVGDRTSSMFKRHGEGKYLLNNQKYTLEFVMNGEKNVYTFSSAYSPMYCSAKMILTDLFDVFEHVDIDDINFHIWQNSTIALNKTTLEWKDNEPIPDAIKKWVRYQTEIDLINALYINLSVNSGTIQKTVGSISMSKTVSIPYIDMLLKELKKKLADAERDMVESKTGYATRKSGGTDYPITDRRGF